MADSYVCSGATMKCTMGTSTARLTVLPIRTVFLTGQPMANISDHLTMVNLAPFGRCRSLGFPATAAATAAHHGHLTPMPCMHNTPFPWMNGKNDYIVKGDPALLKSSTCQCMWGGTITLVTDGQIPTGPADMSQKPREEFDKNQRKKNQKTISVPPMPQIGYEAKPLLTDSRKEQKLIANEPRLSLENKDKIDRLAASLVDVDIPKDYYFFIREAFNDYSKYIKQYKIISTNYSKKLSQFQEKFGQPLLDLDKMKNKYKKIKANKIFEIISVVPLIIQKLIDNFNSSITDLDNIIQNVDKILVEKIKTITTKKGDKMAFITGSDNTGSMEYTLFPKVLEDNMDIRIGNLLKIRGRVEKRLDNLGLIVSKIVILSKE